MQKCNWLIYMLMIATTAIICSSAQADDNAKLNIDESVIEDGTTLELRLEIADLRIDEPCAPDIQGLRHAAIAYREIPGIWFQQDVAACILIRLAILPKLKERIELLEERKWKADELVSIHKEMLHLSETAKQRIEGSLNAAIRGQREAEEKLNHWTRSPWLWGSVGMVVGITVTVLTAYAITSVTKD